MELKQAIKNRKSVRKFVPNTTIDDNVIKDIIELGFAAPNSGNEQSWFFYVIKDEETREKISLLTYDQNFVKDAGVHILCCVKDVDKSKYGQAAHFFKIQDVTCAAQNMLLGCQEYGLGGCYIGALNRTEVTKLLEDIDPPNIVCLLAIGYPDDREDKTERDNTKYKIL